MNTFLGLNLASSPSSYGLTSVKAWIIPILAGLSQYVSTKLIAAQTPNAAGNDQAAQTMKTMNLMMPLMSVWFCFSFATGIGIYWIASAVLMGVQQYFMNKHFEKLDVKEMLKENIAKTNAKRAKKGLPPINEQAAEQNLKRMMEKQARMDSMLEAKQSQAKEKMEQADQYYKTGSIAERARMVQQFEEKKKR
jgi:YidC/Oxa1 family membrane protein insertase